MGIIKFILNILYKYVAWLMDWNWDLQTNMIESCVFIANQIRNLMGGITVTKTLCYGQFVQVYDGIRIYGQFERNGKLRPRTSTFFLSHRCATVRWKFQPSTNHKITELWFDWLKDEYLHCKYMQGKYHEKLHFKKYTNSPLVTRALK